jgi:hypothetical protein
MSGSMKEPSPRLSYVVILKLHVRLPKALEPLEHDAPGKAKT